MVLKNQNLGETVTTITGSQYSKLQRRRRRLFLRDKNIWRRNQRVERECHRSDTQARIQGSRQYESVIKTNLANRSWRYFVEKCWVLK